MSPERIQRFLEGFRRPLDESIWQPLEDELEPVAKYLRGFVLNAGCGRTDIAPFLKKHGATRVEHCDLAPGIEGAFECDLANIPRDTGTYDSVLCNAVLEHVADPLAVTRELLRVLRPGGYAVLAVPFLQPYHGSPTDFRRFTKEGLEQLGRSAGFELVDVLPLHSMAQTLSWIAWTLMRERRMAVLQRAMKVPLYVWCRLSWRTDKRIHDNANSFQGVFRKPLTTP